MVWLAGGSELGICQRLCFGSAFGSPNPLKTPSILDLLGFWPRFLPHPDIWQSAGLPVRSISVASEEVVTFGLI